MRHRRVLIVDDDVSALSAMADQLRTQGYDPVCAGSAEDALRVALTDGADLALVDQFLPGLCGASLVRWLRASATTQIRAMPVIGMSMTRRSERDLVAAGAVCFLEKPLDDGRLKRALDWTASIYWE